MIFEENVGLPPLSFYPTVVRAVSPNPPSVEHVNVHVSFQNGQLSPSPSIKSSTTVVDQPRTIRARPFSPLPSYNTHLAHLLLQLVRKPRILASIVGHLDWVHVYPLLCTCKALHDDLFRSMPHLDVLLSRFVPGYAFCVRQRDFGLYQDVPISLHDLDLLLISQKTPLHRYPTHSLRVLSALYPTYEDDVETWKLARLTQAHTRFVLLLQSIVHSSPHPIPPDPPVSAEDYAMNPSFGILNGSHIGFPPPRIPSRELVFPAPLAFDHSKLTKSAPVSYSARRTSINPYLSQNSSYKLSSPSRASYYDHSDDSSPDGPHKRRTSLLSKNGGRPPLKRPPPPPEEPRAMKIYSDTWRRRSSIGGGNLMHGRSFSLDQVNSSVAQPRFGQSSRSSDSISSSFYAPSLPFAFPSRNTHTPSPPPARRSSFYDLSPTQPNLQTIHTLDSALSRTRAPILRVFVLTNALSSAALAACERQLQDSGAWEHLSVGDIVCNLGYVPGISGPGPIPTVGGGEGGPGVVMRGRSNGMGEFGEMEGSGYSSDSEDSLVRQTQGQTQFRRWSTGSSRPQTKGQQQQPMQTSSWLLFDGEVLIPYTPPDLLHIPNPLSLPSPFYYSHILEQYLNPNPNPGFVLDRLPFFSPVPPQAPHHTHSLHHQQHHQHHHHSYSLPVNGQGNTNASTITVPLPPPKPNPPPPPQKTLQRTPSRSSNPYLSLHYNSIRQLPPSLPPLPDDQNQAYNNSNTPTMTNQHSICPFPPLPSQKPKPRLQSQPQPPQLQTHPFPYQPQPPPPSPTTYSPVQPQPQQITLMQTTSRVPSPKSPTGYVPVKKFVWTGAVRVTEKNNNHSLLSSQSSASGLALNQQFQNSQGKVPYLNGKADAPKPKSATMSPSSSPPLPHNDTNNANGSNQLQPQDEPIGSGWHGTWVFEVEGTREGRELLLGLLAGKMPTGPRGARSPGPGPVAPGGWAVKMMVGQGKQGRGRAGLLCEVVRERSGGGVVWIKVLPM